MEFTYLIKKFWAESNPDPCLNTADTVSRPFDISCAQNPTIYFVVMGQALGLAQARSRLGHFWRARTRFFGKGPPMLLLGPGLKSKPRSLWRGFQKEENITVLPSLILWILVPQKNRPQIRNALGMEILEVRWDLAPVVVPLKLWLVYKQDFLGLL